ncbi:MAG TPA: SDR family oxidoreductase [Microvirga sp.]|nr:SDR family oxidoreductase [Microvirga sp.]
MARKLVVTGASRGLGAHVARKALGEGWEVLGLAYRAVADLPYEVRACDVADPARVSETFKPLKRDPDLWGLVNAAGVASMNLAVATPAATVQRVIGVNLLGTIYCATAFGKLAVRRRGGRIINFSTIAVPLAVKGEAVYAASKAGVEGFTRTFAREMGDFGVTVNAVAPGPVDTDLIAKVPRERIDEIVGRQLIAEQATKDDVWNIVRFLLSDEASAVTGQIINVNGI